MIDLFNFQTSFLNPGLKILVPVLFILGTVYFYRARHRYSGELGKVIQRLYLAGIVGVLAHAFRYAGDLFVIWKWGESLMYLFFGLTNLYAAWPLLVFVRQLPREQTQAKAA